MGRSFPSLADGNLIYHLWTFGDLRILIRCKLHGYTKTPAVRSPSYTHARTHTHTHSSVAIIFGARAQAHAGAALRPGG
jgi:hypothetical protein